ncbi:hypothetical protein D9M71_455210 [compost metagenome]
MRRFVEDQGTRLFLYLLQPATATAGLGRQEAFEYEAIRWQAGGRQCRDQRTGTRNRDYGNASGARLAHEMEARIGNQRRAGIGNQRHIVARLQAGQKASALVALVMLVTGRQRRLDAEVLQQADRVPGVFSGDQSHLAQHPQGPGADVVQVADWRRHHVESAGSAAGGGRKGHWAPRKGLKTRIVSLFTGPTSRPTRPLGTIATFFQRVSGPINDRLPASALRPLPRRPAGCLRQLALVQPRRTAPHS